jgi:hypothetical protein
LLRFSSSKWDESWNDYWTNWTDVLLKSRNFMADLIDVECERDGEAELLEEGPGELNLD